MRDGGGPRARLGGAGWASLKGTKFSAFASIGEMRSFGDNFTECWVHFAERVEADASVANEEGSIRGIIGQFRTEMEYFLLFVNLADDLRV